MVKLKPFFCYFGGKYRAAPKYPQPIHNTIIEPFAGAAGYSIRYYQKNIILYDTSPYIYGLWDYLIKVSSEEILALPEQVNHVDELNIPQEAKWLIGFWLNKATVMPHKTPSTWAKSGVRMNSHWGKIIKERIANQVNYIRHWKIYNKSYEEAIGDESTTWFVDPPYEGKCGQRYTKRINDYQSLSTWCQKLKGQIIVCEREGATWLPFKELAKIKAMGGPKGNVYSTEVMWYNVATNN